MSAGFVKLYGSILDSSIWGEARGTRLVWITMLAMADENGVVIASHGGLAHRANVTRKELDVAIEVLSAPDPDSKSPEFEGRRVDKVDGGWRVLNHRKYRDMRTPKQVATAKRVAEHRAKNRGVTGNKCNTGSREASASGSESGIGSGQGEPEGDGPSELELNSKLWIEDPNLASFEAPEPWTWRPVLEVLAHFDAVYPGTPTVCRNWSDPRLQKVIGGFADGKTVADLSLAIDGSKLDEHIAKNAQFHSLTTILRDAGQIDRFTRLAKSGARPASVPRGTHQPKQPNAGHWKAPIEREGDP